MDESKLHTIVTNMLAIPDNLKNTDCLIDTGLHIFDKDLLTIDPALRLNILLKNESESNIRTRLRVNIIGKTILNINENDVTTLHHTTYTDLLERIHNKIIASKLDSIYELESFSRIFTAIAGIYTPNIEDKDCTLVNVKNRLNKLLCAAYTVLKNNNQIDIFNKYTVPYSNSKQEQH